MEREKQHHVLMVTNNYTPYVSGVVHSIQATRHALELAGHRVTLATLDFRDAPCEERVIRIRSFFRRSYRGNPIAIPWRSTHALRTLVAALQPTIIHSHHPFLLGVAALRAAREGGVPIVFTHHTRYERFVYHVPAPALVTRYAARHCVARYCAQVDRVIAPSHSMAEYIADYGVERSRICVIPSPLHSSAPDYIPKSHDGTLELLTVGRFSPEKNIDAIIDALAILAKYYPALEWRMTIVGYGPEEQALKARAYVQHGLSSQQVLFAIKPPRELIKTLYQRAHLFLFASQSDAQGLVLAEALAAGLPIIAQKCPIVAEAVEHRHNGFLVQNSRQMADFVALCASQNSLYEALSRAAAASASKYSLSAHQQALLDLYNSLD